MKFLDKKGKLFGKINIIDFCVIIIVIVLIAGAVYKFKFMDKTSNNVAMQPITYTVKVEKVRDYALNNIEIGDTLFDKTSGNAIGTITNVESEPATDYVIMNDGSMHGRRHAHVARGQERPRRHHPPRAFGSGIRTHQ